MGENMADDMAGYVNFETLAYIFIDLEARSRRNNLIFWEFFEIPNENCFVINRDFIADKLDLDPRRMYLTVPTG